jgi:hypothetical protein
MAFGSRGHRGEKNSLPNDSHSGQGKKAPGWNGPGVPFFNKIPYKYLAYANLLKYYYFIIDILLSSR